MRRFSNGIDIFLYVSFLGGVTPCGNNTVTDVLVEYLEENYVVIHAFGVGVDIDTTEEMPPFFHTVASFWKMVDEKPCGSACCGAC